MPPRRALAAVGASGAAAERRGLATGTAAAQAGRGAPLRGGGGREGGEREGGRGGGGVEGAFGRVQRGKQGANQTFFVLFVCLRGGVLFGDTQLWSLGPKTRKTPLLRDFEGTLWGFTFGKAFLGTIIGETEGKEHHVRGPLAQAHPFRFIAQMQALTWQPQITIAWDALACFARDDSNQFDTMRSFCRMRAVWATHTVQAYTPT